MHLSIWFKKRKKCLAHDQIATNKAEKDAALNQMIRGLYSSL